MPKRDPTPEPLTAIIARIVGAVDLPSIIGMVLIFLFVLWLLRVYADGISS